MLGVLSEIAIAGHGPAVRNCHEPSNQPTGIRPCQPGAGGGRQLGRARDDGRRTLRQQALQVQRTTGLGTGARQAFTAEGLHAHHGTDGVAVDVQVAGVDLRQHDGLAVAGAKQLGLDAIDRAQGLFS